MDDVTFDNVRFDYQLSRWLDGEPHDRALDFWTVTCVGERYADEGPHEDTPVAVLDAYGLDSELAHQYGERPADVADSSDADALNYFSALFDTSGNPRQDLTEVIEGWPGAALVIDRVEVQPGWRGRGIARLLIAEACLTLSRSYGVVATLPSTRRSDDTIRLVRLHQLVERLGFIDFHDELWIADPAAQQTIDTWIAARRWSSVAG